MAMSGIIATRAMTPNESAPPAPPDAAPQSPEPAAPEAPEEPEDSNLPDIEDPANFETVGFDPGRRRRRELESEMLEVAEEKIPVCAVGVQDRFGEVGKLPYLREVTGLTVENIVASAKKALTLK